MRLPEFSRSQWWAITILMLVNFVNYVDRQVIFSLFPAIRHDFGLSYQQLGYLATAFTVVLSLSTFPLGMVADRLSRRSVISAGVLFWSGATFLSGLAGSFRSLLAARALVGVGEAAYTSSPLTGTLRLPTHLPDSMEPYGLPWVNSAPSSGRSTKVISPACLEMNSDAPVTTRSPSILAQK